MPLRSPAAIMRSIRLNRLEAQLAMLFVAGILSYTTIGTLHALQLQIWTGFSTDVMASGIVEGPPRQQELDLGWYAPSRTAINDLERVVEEKGVYGFIYNSSRIPDDLPYSTYNWCNMPHVRRTEYIIPPARYKLDYVEVIHRHHKRTPYAENSFPAEAYAWDCDDEALFHYGSPSQDRQSAHTYWKGYVSSSNPFAAAGWQGTCHFPQITAEGLQDSWQHGKDIYEVYRDLAFLPDDLDDSLEFRVTNNVITSEVAGMVLNGMFGTRKQVPLLVQVGRPYACRGRTQQVLASGIDSLEPKYSCPRSAHLFRSIQHSTSWRKLLASTSSLYNALDSVSGVPPTDIAFHRSIDHYYDNLSARQCHSKPLPCKLSDKVSCISQLQADFAYRIGHYEYSYTYRDDPRSLEASVASFGVWIAELSRHFRDAAENKSQVRYRHNIAHDGSIARLLSILQIDEMVWPGMGSEVIFELYHEAPARIELRDASPVASAYAGHYIRVLWKGQVLRSSSPTLGVLDMLPLGVLLGYLDGLVGIDASLIKSKCDWESLNLPKTYW